MAGIRRQQERVVELLRLSSKELSCPIWYAR